MRQSKLNGIRRPKKGLSLMILLVSILCSRSYSQTRRGGWDGETSAFLSEASAISALVKLCVRAYGPPACNISELDACMSSIDLSDQDRAIYEEARVACESEIPSGG